MKSAPRAGLYARVSTADQQTLPMQLSAMNEYAEQRGWTVVAAVQDVNGGTKQRPKREELIRLAKQRKIDVIVVWRLDRWGRSLADLVHNFAELQAIKVSFVSITEQLDFTTPTGRAMAGMLGIFAEFERDILRERVKAGLEHARSKGKVLGRPTSARDKAYEIQRLFAQGMSKKQIAERLNIGRASVFRVLQSV